MNGSGREEGKLVLPHNQTFLALKGVQGVIKKCTACYKKVNRLLLKGVQGVIKRCTACY